MVELKRPSTANRSTKSPSLSIIVTSYTTQRIEDVYELLESIKAQTGTEVETIFVAERSTELADMVKKYVREKSIDNVKVLFNDGEPGASAARNLGIREARGDIIAFVDDDVILFPDWSEEIVNAYEDESIIGVTGSALPLWKDGVIAWLPEEFYWIIGCTAFGDWNNLTEVRSVWTMNGSYKREAFDMGEVFSTALGPHGGNKGGWRGLSEEVELSMRIKSRSGKRILYNPRARVQHKVYRNKLTRGYIAECAYWIGLSRHILKRLSANGNRGASVLSMEERLLKRIFTRLFPGILKTFFRNPVIACQQLSVTVIVLFFAAFGYYSHLLPEALRR